MKNLGLEAQRLDAKLSKFIKEGDRANIWNSCRRILEMKKSGKSTVMGLGYVQSGKTTSISALCAMASDEGYRLIIAVLGSTVLLRNQNTSRVEQYLGVDEQNYKWHSISDFNLKSSPGEIENYLERGRTVFLPVIKNVTVIKKVAEILNRAGISSTKVLIIDDEADQGSLNTKLNAGAESSTYSALGNLRLSVGDHLFIQYTATPYAPLLLPENDPLMPEDVEFLQPGHGYTGGREFFIEHAAKVIRYIPESDEQTVRTRLDSLPKTLEHALCAFIVGSAHLFQNDATSAPISMLIHSTFKNDLQEQYSFLVERYLRAMKAETTLESSYFGKLLTEERNRLYSMGISPMNNQEFWETVSYCLREVTLWLVNSASEVKLIKWKSAPFHILMGGNKLDRGFTVEGLTVTYMNRPVSPQIDTLEQRARAFGYRTSLLPFCQFFATAKTIRVLTGIVHTEDDLRASLKDYLEQGKSVHQWAREIGLLVPGGSQASRRNVLPSLDNFNPDGDWLSLRKPLTDAVSNEANAKRLLDSGLFDADFKKFGRPNFRAIELPLGEIYSLISTWQFDAGSPGWRHDQIIDYIQRMEQIQTTGWVVLMENPDSPDRKRVRSWTADIGFSNLFQGRDLKVQQNGDFYPGDRDLKSFLQTEQVKEPIILQIHRLQRREWPTEDIYSLAIQLTGTAIIRKK